MRRLCLAIGLAGAFCNSAMAQNTEFSTFIGELQTDPTALGQVDGLASNSGGLGIWNTVLAPQTAGVGVPALVPQINTLIRDTAIDQSLVGMTLAATRDGRLVYSGAFGFSNWETKAPMENHHRAPIGSSTKVFVTMGLMHALDAHPTLSLSSRVYGGQGILSDPDYLDAIRQGVRTQKPVLDLAIGSNNQVTAWYSDGTFSVGTSADLDKHAAPKPFSFPPKQSANTVVGIARGGPDNRVYSWYADGSHAIGTRADLAAFDHVQAADAEDGFKSRRKDTILGIAADTEREIFYAYYSDGFVTSGDRPDNLQNRFEEPLVVPGNQNRRYDLTGVARSANDVQVAWYSDNKVSKGNARDLGRVAGLSDGERPAKPGSRRQWIDAYHEIRLRHLVSHTAGLSNSGNRDRAVIKYASDITPGVPPGYKISNLYVLSTRPLLSKPGVRWSYSNHGLGLSAHVLSEISGQDWFDYLHEHIFEPAAAGAITSGGLDVSVFDDSAEHKTGGGQVETTMRAASDEAGSGAGALRATAIDLARVLVATDGLPNHADVLPADVIDLMESRPFPDVNPAQAHGWGVDCKGADPTCASRRLSHNGLVDRGASYIVRFRDYTLDTVPVDGVTVSIVTNTRRVSGLGALADEIAKVVAQTDNPTGMDLFVGVSP
ncbi:MAG: serine hydrolase domain-containing protein [Pseudomonadota bacterium]